MSWYNAVLAPTKFTRISEGPKLVIIGEDVLSILDDIKQRNINYQINEICFELNSMTTREHIQLLFEAIEEYNSNSNRCNIERMTLKVARDEQMYRPHKLFGPLTKLNGLHCPTKYFKLDIPCIGTWTNLFTEIAATLASGTNFNQFSFADVKIFLTEDIPVDGFKEFCEYFIHNKDRSLSLEMKGLSFSEPTVPHLHQLIRESKGLTNLMLTMHFTDATEVTIFDVLANSSVKTLYLELQDARVKSNRNLYTAIGKMIGDSPMLEDLTIQLYSYNLKDDDIRNGLKATQSLRKLKLWLLAPLDNLSILAENESVVEYCAIRYADIPLRNRKLQNERVRSMIVLLYNIARSSNCNKSSDESMPVLPRDVWALIVSHVKYPGVTLDFGPIARSIFKDQSIRRVI